jgi:hypothetical protein
MSAPHLYKRQLRTPLRWNDIDSFPNVEVRIDLKPCELIKCKFPSLSVRTRLYERTVRTQGSMCVFKHDQKIGYVLEGIV